jgi:membrane protease YdiL (CAAX protease family)
MAVGVYLTHAHLGNLDDDLTGYFVFRGDAPGLRPWWLAAACFLPIAIASLSVAIDGIAIASDVNIAGLLSYAVAGVVQPTAEELVMRLLLLAGLARLGVRLWLAVLIQALVFALLHPEVGYWAQAVVVLYALSLALALLLYRSLWVAVALHSLFNLCEIVRGLLSGESFGSDSLARHLEPGEVVVPAFTAVALLFWAVAACIVTRLNLNAVELPQPHKSE